MVTLPGTERDAWRAPLLPVALAFSVGMIFDRATPIPLLISLLISIAASVAWCVARSARSEALSLMLLAAAFIAAGAAWYHVRQFVLPWDIGYWTADAPRSVRIRGSLEVEPAPLPVRATEQAFRSWPPTQADEKPARTVIRVTRIHTEEGWRWATGMVVVWLPELPADMHPGDRVEASGWLERPRGPANPGEFDYAAHLHDLGIRATLRADRWSGGMIRVAENWPLTFRGWLAVLRGWGHQVLRTHLGDRSGIAGALLLGEGATMTPEAWDRYIRTGVVHVLAISGQHLVILGWFLGSLLAALRLPGRRATVVVAVLLFGYALLTGGRPPALRAAFMVALICGGRILWRPLTPANTLAFAWIMVAVVDPTEIFDTGCQLSFLAVAVLHRIEFGRVNVWLPTWLRPLPPDDPLEYMEEETQPAAVQALRWIWRKILLAFFTTLAVAALVTPLVAARMHLVTPVGVLLGPPVVVLTSIALVSGFLLLLAAAVCPVLAPPFAWVTGASLAGCDVLVGVADRLPFGHFHVPEVPEWWLWGFYGGLFGLMWMRRLYGPWAAVALAAWLGLGAIAVTVRVPSDELRCTVLSVGHGSCVVLETPDRRVLLYDAGSLSGPEVARRQIAPYLWHRGIGRIDEVILSHADLDHFNGLPPLLERFAVGRVTLTPSFTEKRTPGVARIVNELENRGVEVQRAWDGHRLTAGTVEMRVLHPPEQGPEGSENTRSLVLEVQHQGRSILLTGDLEGSGLQRLLAREPRRTDVLLAPHHGSAAASPVALAEWARPAVVISSQRRGEGKKAAVVYEATGARFLGTDAHGAVTVHVHARGMLVETFRSDKRLVVPP